MIRLVLAGGGTGGHLFPGLALARSLQRLAPATGITFLGTRHGLERELVPAHGYELRLLAAGRGSPLSPRHPLNPVRFAIAWLQSWLLLRRLDPAAVIILGGYAAAAPGLAAAWLRIPLVVLEPNTIPGRVTRLLARHARQVHLQFPETGARLRTPGRVCVSGVPVRTRIARLARKSPVRGDALLVVGGSQGARDLNRMVLAALRSLPPATLPRNILHLAGPAHVGEVEQAYGELAVAARVLAFAEDMAAAYNGACLAVCRAGAGTIAELACAGLPAVFIPLPCAKDDHQRHNARAMAATGSAMVLEQDLTDVSGLAGALRELLHNPIRLQAMARAMRAHARPDAVEVIAASIMELAAA